MDKVFIFILIGIILVGIITIGYIIVFNNLQNLKIKINESEGIIDECLRKKYDFLFLIKEIIINETKMPEKTFEEYDDMANDNISSFEFERKLAMLNTLIMKIKSDYDFLIANDDLNNYFCDINEINEKLEATKSFYNKYTSILNKKIKMFPSNIVAMIHHIKVRAYFDGKDMFDDEIRDFKL